MTTEYITPSDGWHVDPPRPRQVSEQERAIEAGHVREIISARLIERMPEGDWARLGNPDFEERVHPRIKRVAEKWTPDRDNLLVLGKSGVGKTFGLVALAHRLAHEAIQAASRKHPIVRAHWTDGYTLVASVRRHGLGDGLPDEVQRALDTPLLFLDELGHEPGGRDNYDPILWELIDTRYRKRRLTLVTSGLTRVEFEHRYGSAFVRRILEPKGRGHRPVGDALVWETRPNGFERSWSAESGISS